MWVGLDLVLLVRRATSSGVFRGGCGLRKILGSLSADGWGCVPTLLVVWLEASQHWSLQTVWWGRVLVSRWWPPGELTPMSISQFLCQQCLYPHSEPQPHPTFSGIPSRPAGRPGPGSYEVTAFFLGPSAHETLCAPSKSGVSVSPSPVEVLQSNPASLQSLIL